MIGTDAIETLNSTDMIKCENCRGGVENRVFYGKNQSKWILYCF